MGIPAKLKNMNLFLDGITHLAKIPEYTPPKVSLQIEDYRGGGMLGPIGVNLGVEKLEAEFTAGGLIVAPLVQFGAAQHDAAMLRFAGAFQSDSSGGWTAVEDVLRGRYTEIDNGNRAPGKDTEHKFKFYASYYRQTIGGIEALEIDMLGGVFRVYGVDRMAEMRAIIDI